LRSIEPGKVKQRDAYRGLCRADEDKVSIVACSIVKDPDAEHNAGKDIYLGLHVPLATVKHRRPESVINHGLAINHPKRECFTSIVLFYIVIERNRLWERMRESNQPSAEKWNSPFLKALVSAVQEIQYQVHRFRHNFFVISLLLIILCVFAFLNAYLNFLNISSYSIDQQVLSPFLLAGYLGMFITVAFLPIPDYLLLPAYGSLSSLGVFDPYATFLVCLAAAVLPVQYLPGRFAGRPLLLKGVAYFGISERSIESAEKWLVEHGKFSIFISTFIPYFYTVTSLAAGVFKMNAGKFLLASAAGFGLRYAFLEFIGYNGIYIFTASFDYSQRALIVLLLILSSLYALYYLLGDVRSSWPDSNPR
jgi:membrane protein DedA with SNARE-associated domain